MKQTHRHSTALDARESAPFPDDLLTFDELAAKLKIGRQTVPRLLRRYGIPVTVLAPNTHRITRQHYQQLLAQCTAALHHCRLPKG